MRREWLKDMREDRGFSQVGLAKLIGVSRIIVQAWERGFRSPSPIHRAALAKHLGSAIKTRFQAEDDARFQALQSAQEAAS